MMDMNPDIVAAIDNLTTSVRFCLLLICVLLMWIGKR